jgi:hypothetical protein
MSVSGDIIVCQTFDVPVAGSWRSSALTSTIVEAHAGPSAWNSRRSPGLEPMKAMLVDRVP